MQPSDLYLKSLGVHVPETVSVAWAIDQGLCTEEEAAEHGMTGAAVAGDVPAPELALIAARNAFDRCGHAPDDLDLMLYTYTWPQGPQDWLPYSLLQDRLTGGEVTAMEVRQGCSGIFGAMELATAYLRADPERRAALLVGADNYGTPLIDRWHAGPFVLGDAAAALLVTREPGFARILSVASTTVPEGTDHHGDLFPPALTIGQTLDPNARRARMMAQPDAMSKLTARIIELQAALKKLLDKTLAQAGIGIEDLAQLATMNSARQIVEHHAMSIVGVDNFSPSLDFGATIGHCGTTDQVLSLDHLLTEGILKPGDHFGMIGIGPGLVLSCAVLQIVSTPPWLEREAR